MLENLDAIFISIFGSENRFKLTKNPYIICEISSVFKKDLRL